MKEGLESLYDLQLLDDQVVEISQTLKNIPLTIKSLENERDGKANIIEQSRQKLESNLKAREKLEKEILLVKEKIVKYKEQMSKATTNREYQGFTAEIQYEEKNIAAIEEQIIEKMLESDEIVNEIRTRETEFQNISSEYNQKINDLKKNLAYTKTKLSEAETKKEKLRSNISEKLVKVYDNLFKKKNGKAITYVESDFCGVCNMKIRPQILNEMISTNQLLICENCGRILYTRLDKEPERNPGN